MDEIPFKPGMRALYDSRADQADDPHTRCKPSGGSRFWHTPYGIEIVDSPETQEVILPARGRAAQLARRLHGRSPASEGREADLWYGHTTGKWEGDTLVMDTVGFNDRFWVTREGVPTTKQLHLIEKLSRPNHDQLRTKPPSMIRAPTPRRGPAAGTCAGARATSPSTTSARKTTAIRRA